MENRFILLLALTILIYSSYAIAPGAIIFQEDFSTQTKLNTKIWSHEITASGCGNWEFEWYTNSRITSYVENQTLFLQPDLTKTVSGVDPMTPGAVLQPGGAFPDACTDLNDWGCRRETSGQNIINPVASARINTKNSFSFKYGKMEVVAKLPCGDWTWPAIWLLPRNTEYGGWPASGEIDVMESRGNVGAKSGSKKIGPEAFSTTLHWGPRWDQNKWSLTHAEHELGSGTFCDAFHTFGLNWQKDKMIVYLDSETNVIATFDITNLWTKGGFSGKNIWKGGDVGAPFDQEYYIILNVAVGGVNGYFPDDAQYVRGKPWPNSSGNAPLLFLSNSGAWQPTWNNNAAAMQIKKVTVWSVADTQFSYST